MRVKIRDFEKVENGIKVNRDCIVGIDMSTTKTGICIMDYDKKPLYSICLYREKESSIEYKVKLKRFIGNEILKPNKSIKITVQEEPIPTASYSAEILYSMRTSMAELIAEEETLRYIQHKERGNGAWKAAFLKPNKLPYPRNTEKEKTMVYNKVIGLYPEYEGAEYDETDAFGIAYTHVMELSNEIDSIANKEKVKPFKYEVDFVGCYDEEAVLDYLLNPTNIPKKPLKNGIAISELSRNDRVDEKVYRVIGNEDIIAVIEITEKTAGHIILKHEISYLFKEHEKVYMIAWRKNRKNK